MMSQRAVSDLWRGFGRMLPLSLTAAPMAVAYVFAAKKAGLNDFEVQILSLTLSSAATQLALLNDGSLFAALVTVALLNLHHAVYGLSLSRSIPLSGRERFLAALFLTDAVYGVSATDSDLTLFSLIGAGMNMYVIWNLLTGAALIVHGLITMVTLPPLDIVPPLAFCGLLVLSLKTWRDAVVALMALGTAVLLNGLGLKGAVIFVTTLVAVCAGSWLMDQQGEVCR